MDDDVSVTDDVDGTEESEQTPAPIRKPRKRFVGRALLVVGAVLAPITMTSLFVRNIVLDTDKYVETVSPLGSDPAIRAAAVTRVTDTIMSAVDVPSVLDSTLPGPLQVISGPVEAAVRSMVAETTENVLASERFAQIWDDANRVAHQSITKLLTDTDLRELPDGRVVVDLTPVAEQVTTILVDRGLTFFARIPITRLVSGLELFDASQLQSAQEIVSLMDTLVTVLVVLTLACFVGAIALASDRRRAVAHVGIALAAGTALLMTAINVGRNISLGSLPDTVNQDAAAATFDILTRFFRQGIRTAFGLGLVMVLGAWLAGPGRVPAKIRGLVTSRNHTADTEPSAAAIWVADHSGALKVGIVAVVGVLAVSVERPSLVTVFVGALLLVAGFATVSLTAARR